MDLQTIIFKFDRYWAKQGCAVAPAAADQNAAAGARGDLSLAGAVRLPEPCGPDGRYRYRVLLTPAPGAARRLFLAAVECAGVDRTEHDLRWREAGKASLPRGAAGPSWEILLDGERLAVFSYLRAGSTAAVWLEFCLERLALASQCKQDFSGLAWSGALTYGRLHGAGREGAAE